MGRKSIILVLGIGILLVASGQRPEQDRADHSGLTLDSPSFVALAAQAEGQEGGTNFLQQEAGIAAYVKVDQTIDIPKLRSAFKVVEQLSDTYLTGQIAIPDLEENLHPRVFVAHSPDDQGSWIVAYYPHDEPTSKILAVWITRSDTELTGTTLELAIRETIRSAGIGSLPAAEEIRYYHFRHPDADRIMLIREDTQGQDFFNLTIPSNLGLSDASWVAYDNVRGWSGMDIDGERLVGDFNGIQFGDLFPKLRRDAVNKITVTRGSYGIVLLYQAP